MHFLVVQNRLEIGLDLHQKLGKFEPQRFIAEEVDDQRPPLARYPRQPLTGVGPDSEPGFKLLEMLRFLLLMPPQELENTGRNLFGLRRAYRPQGHRLSLEESFQ